MADAVQHMNPFRDTELSYRKAGWLGTLPIPFKEKNPPPTGFTGHRAPYPNATDIEKFRAQGRRNICLRLAGVDQEHEIIGIDVDHYKKGGKTKKGGDQLSLLEAQFGALPPTWISSSRTDGFSGIRYYRVPRKLAWRGQVDKDIECISKGYRFAVTWPSVHPSGEIYWWFPPGVRPDAAGRDVWNQEIPDARQLPLLPDAWLDYLTQGRMQADVDDRIDNDSTPDEIYEWAYGLFHGDPETDHVCKLYRDKLDKHKNSVLDSATLHDKIINAHMNFIKLASEGHVGWTQAIYEFEQLVWKFVQDTDKGRSVEELKGELFRSRTNALRKVKAQIDERLKIGAAPVGPSCELPGNVCEVNDGDGDTDSGDDPPPDDPLSDVPRGPIVPVDNYDLHDDGNAKHFVDMYSNLKMGPAVRYVDGFGWMIWHQGKGEEQPHWSIDREGNQEMRRMWWRVRDRQKDRVELLKQDYYTKLDLYDTQQPGTSKSDVEAAKALYREFKAFAEKSGNNYTAANAIRAVQSRDNVTISVNKIDNNPLLLGVENGILELGNDDVKLRPAEPDDLITMNTGVPYLDKPSDLAMNIWNNYLETFLPDLELRNIVQVVMGHILLGDNRQKKIIVLKGGTNTGKSTMISAIGAALGSYAASINESVFQSSQFSEVLVNVLNKRVAYCSEFDSNIELSGSVVKRLAGLDEITQAIKYSNEVRTGLPKFTMILATNGVPKINDPDKALQERLYVIPFETVPLHVNYNQGNVVKEVAGTAVLWWLVEGFKQFNLNKELPKSKLIDSAITDFMSELDDISTFLDEAVIKHDKIDGRVDWKQEPDWCIKRSELFKHYKHWCEINEIPERNKLAPKGFTQRIKALGIPGSPGVKTTRVEGVTGTWWYGVKAKKLRSGGNVFKMPNVSVSRPESDTNEEK